MTKEFFYTQIDRMGRAWTAPNEEYQQLLWARVKHAENDQFESAVGYLIGEHTGRQLPGVSRFTEALSHFRPGGQKGGPVEITYTCDKCRDDGWVVDGYDRATGAGMVEHCTCARGRHMNPSEIVKIQKDFDAGARVICGGRSPFPPLPYDPKKRQGA